MSVSRESDPSTVLIIEDNPSILEMYSVIFDRSVGFEAVVKPTPSEGLAYFKANKDTTHLVILDRDLPEMLGDAVAERMRQISGKEDDPYILMISGCAAQLDVNTLRAKGVNSLLAKPFLPSAIIRELTQVNQRFQSSRTSN